MGSPMATSRVTSILRNHICKASKRNLLKRQSNLNTWKHQTFYLNTGVFLSLLIHDRPLISYLISTNWYDAQATMTRLCRSIATPETIKAMQKAIRKVNSLARRIETTEQHLLFIKDQLGLHRVCWSEASEEYQTTKHKLAKQKYHRALDELQCLIIQCLFKLSKLNVSGMGMLATRKT